MSKKKVKNGEMTLTDHLRELRGRIIVCILALIIGMLLCLQYAGNIVDVLIQQGVTLGYQFVFIAPQEMIIQYFKIAMIGAIVVALPILLYELWAFFSPGLSKKEKSYFFFAMILGIVCFLIGVLFAYKISLPFMLNFLIDVNFSTVIVASISVANYLSFVLTVYIIFGVIFEMPMVTVLLTQLGLLRPQWMKAARPYMIVVIFFIAAVITPPDIFSQIMVAIPMCVLYEISIFLSRLFYQKKTENE